MMCAIIRDSFGTKPIQTPPKQPEEDGTEEPGSAGEDEKGLPPPCKTSIAIYRREFSSAVSASASAGTSRSPSGTVWVEITELEKEMISAYTYLRRDHLR